MKANYGTIGVSGKVNRTECMTANDKSRHTESIAKWAIDAGKSVGLVTTARVTHASPAGKHSFYVIINLWIAKVMTFSPFNIGLYAHSADRNWEGNADVLNSHCDDVSVDDIAEQLIHGDIGRQMKVIFGGGRSRFYDESTKNPQGHKGQRTDGKDLIQEWLNYGSSNDQRRKYTWNKVRVQFVHICQL